MKLVDLGASTKRAQVVMTPNDGDASLRHLGFEAAGDNVTGYVPWPGGDLIHIERWRDGCDFNDDETEPVVFDIHAPAGRLQVMQMRCRTCPPPADPETDLPFGNQIGITRQFYRDGQSHETDGELKDCTTDICVTVADLLANPDFPASPFEESREIAGFFDLPMHTVDEVEWNRYGARVSGILRAPVGGSHIFYLSSGSTAELYITSDPTSGAVHGDLGCQGVNSSACEMLAAVTTPNLPGNWDDPNADPECAPTCPMAARGTKYLRCGGYYYVEVLTKEGEGADFLSLRIDIPGRPVADPPEAASASLFSALPGEVTGCCSALACPYITHLPKDGKQDLACVGAACTVEECCDPISASVDCELELVADLETSSEQGWKRVTSAGVGAPTTFVLLEDIDECLVPGACDPNARCENTMGGYVCTCNFGFSDDGLGGCRRNEWSCHPLRIRVSPAHELSCQWRVKEVSVFTDDVCAEPIAAEAVVVSASGSTTRHEADLAIDGFQQTEWWSECLACSQGQAWIELEVTLPDGSPCRVSSVKIVQADNHATDYMVARGPGVAYGRPGLPAETGVRNGGEIMQHIHEDWTEVWASSGTEECIATTCGESNTRFVGDEMWRYYGIPSACHCKQLCLDQLQDGCEGWTLYIEEDQSFGVDPTNGTAVDDTHTHHICFLWRAPRQASSAHPFATWISGTPGAILQSVTIAGSTDLTLSVHGVGLPVSATSRIKLVEDGDDCAGEPIAEVEGLSCSASAVCSPGPSVWSSSLHAWSGLRLWSMAKDRPARVCFCADNCESWWHFAQVPGVVSLATPKFHFTTHATADATITAEVSDGDAQAFLKISRAPFSSYSDRSAWTVKLLPITSFGRIHKATPRCDGQSPDWITAITQSATIDPNEAVFRLQLNQPKASYLLVCLAEGPAASYNPVPHADGSKLLTVKNASPIQSESGPFVSNRFSVSISTGSEGFSKIIDVLGRYDDDTTVGNQLKFGPEIVEGENAQIGNDFCTAGANGFQQEFAAAEVPRAPDAEFHGHSYTVSTNGAQAGRYVVCNNNQRLGTAFLATADLERIFYFTAGIDQSIEITGHDLSLDSRIMVIDCQGVCGVTDHTQAIVKPGSSGRPTSPWLELAPIAGEEVADATDVQAAVAFTAVLARFCRGGDLDTSGNPQRCFIKCRGSAAGCNGYMPGVDTENSMVLCMPRQLCVDACAARDDCDGVVMHKSRDRCILKVRDPCRDQFRSASLGMDPDYDFLVRRSTEYELGSLVALRPNMAYGTEIVSTPALVATSAFFAGGSSDRLLRFGPVQIGQGGTYKVCLCDESCGGVQDFNVEVGEIRVTGLSCLVRQAELRKLDCRQQFHGGLRCGPYFSPLPVEADQGTNAQDLTAFDLMEAERG